jgi:hypothetical protein
MGTQSFVVEHVHAMLPPFRAACHWRYGRVQPLFAAHHHREGPRCDQAARLAGFCAHDTDRSEFAASTEQYAVLVTDAAVER